MSLSLTIGTSASNSVVVMLGWYTAPSEPNLPREFGQKVLWRSLGAGGCGQVFLARPLDPNSDLPELVVLKTIHRELASSADFLERFRHEGRLTVLLSSSHIAGVFLFQSSEIEQPTGSRRLAPMIPLQNAVLGPDDEIVMSGDGRVGVAAR